MHLIENCSRNSKKWHLNFSRPSGFYVIDQNSKNVVWINNSRTAWPTLILMLFLSSLDNLLEDAYTIFQKDVDNLEIEHKTC